MKYDEIKTKEDARQYAIDWQSTWQDNQYSYADIIDWQNTFEYLASKYDLKDEFIENGVL